MIYLEEMSIFCKRKKNRKYRDHKYWFCICNVLAIYILGIYKAIHSNNTTYAIEQIHQYNNKIFSNNFAVCNEDVSARFFMNHLVSFGMKICGGEWVTVAVILIYLGVVILTIATVDIVFNITEEYRIVFSIVLAIFIRYNVNTGFPGWGSFEVDSLGMGTAYSITMLAFSKVVGRKKDWAYAWIILSIATLCHIHEGIWGGCLLILFYLIDACNRESIKPDKFQCCFFVFFITMIICVVPGFFYEESEMTSKEFVEIYAMWRHPHHLVPSAWGWMKLSSI